MSLNSLLGTLYMHNHDDKHPNKPGFEPGSLRLQAQVDTNKPSWLADVKAYTPLKVIEV